MRLTILERGIEPATAWTDPSAYHPFASGSDRYVYLANGSRIYSVSDLAYHLLTAPDTREETRDVMLGSLGLTAGRQLCAEPETAVPMRSVSLAVAATCNLGCTYCYADGGSFSSSHEAMSEEVARRTVELLVDQASPGDRLQIAYMGGEPLLNRRVVRATTEHALELARRVDVEVGFAITTNGTLVTSADADFFARHDFAVTVSLDGRPVENDRQRPTRGGKGSHALVVDKLRLLHEAGVAVGCRATVTPDQRGLRETLDHLLSLGFESVGFAPMRSSPSGHDEMGEEDLGRYLSEMLECGAEFERRAREGRRYAFTNLEIALMNLHRGVHRPYPCGAGAGYFGVAADGQLAACHRFVGDPRAMMGDLVDGVNADRQERWLTSRHVDAQQPCASCWARYLCGGGCHHEVMTRGRSGCDYIRGWLSYCLGLYARLLRARPQMFER